MDSVKEVQNLMLRLHLHNKGPGILRLYIPMELYKLKLLKVSCLSLVYLKISVNIFEVVFNSFKKHLKVF